MKVTHRVGYVIPGRYGNVPVYSDFDRMDKAQDYLNWFSATHPDIPVSLTSTAR